MLFVKWVQTLGLAVDPCSGDYLQKSDLHECNWKLEIRKQVINQRFGNQDSERITNNRNTAGKKNLVILGRKKKHTELTGSSLGKMAGAFVASLPCFLLPPSKWWKDAREENKNKNHEQAYLPNEMFLVTEA